MSMKEYILTHTFEELLEEVDRLFEENRIPQYDENDPPSNEEI